MAGFDLIDCYAALDESFEYIDVMVARKRRGLAVLCALPGLSASERRRHRQQMTALSEYSRSALLMRILDAFEREHGSLHDVTENFLTRTSVFTPEALPRMA